MQSSSQSRADVLNRKVASEWRHYSWLVGYPFVTVTFTNEWAQWCNEAELSFGLVKWSEGPCSPFVSENERQKKTHVNIQRDYRSLTHHHLKPVKVYCFSHTALSLVYMVLNSMKLRVLSEQQLSGHVSSSIHKCAHEESTMCVVCVVTTQAQVWFASVTFERESETMRAVQAPLCVQKWIEGRAQWAPEPSITYITDERGEYYRE